MSENKREQQGGSPINHELVVQNNMLAEMVTTEKGRNSFSLVTVCVVQLIVIIFLGYLAFVYFPQEKYLPSANAAAVCGVYALDEQNVTDAVAADFAAQAVVASYTYTFQNYRQAALDAADRYFTPEFRGAYLTTFGESANLRNVIANFYQVYASSAGVPPVVKKKGTTETGVFYWDVQVVANVTYTSGRRIIPDKILATVRVQRLQPSRTAHLNGLGVSMIQTEAFGG
jgi:hypothetical protein